MKTATTKNIQGLLDLIKQQQTYTNALGEHINTLYTKLAQLEQQIQVHCIYLHNNTDEVQLEAPAYDPDIGGHIQQEDRRHNNPQRNIQPIPKPTI